MTMRVRTVLMLIVALAMMGLASCGHYTCAAGFGASTCTPSSTGLGGGGTTGSATAAFVFVADPTGAVTTGTIDGYTLNTTASTFGPTPSYTAPTTPLSDGGVGMVVAQEKYLYTGFGSSDQIYGWSISSTGGLTALTGSPYSASFMSLVPSASGTQSVITNPAGTLLFFSAFGGEVYVYQIGTGGALTPVTGSPFSAGFSGNLATDGLGKYLYVTDTEAGTHTGSQIAAYAIGSTGALTVVPGSPFAFPMWQVQGDPTGDFLIGTTGQSALFNGTDNDSLYVFSITQSGSSAGAIAAVSGSPFTTAYSPLSIAVQSNTGGSLVYSFGLTDSGGVQAFSPVEGYSLGSSGALSLASGSPFLSAALGDLGALDQSGTFLFVYGGIIDSSTVTYQMGALDVGSGGALTQPTSTLTLTNGGFFAVTDPQ
ncbi:MAG: hypothetical protein WAM69_19745 [Candidatus Sulfotelmatobacter sp.]